MAQRTALIHTDLTRKEIEAALQRAKDKGRVSPRTSFTVLEEQASGSHPHAFRIELGEWYRVGKRDMRFMTPWPEWGWFLSEVFSANPGAWCYDWAYVYFSAEDFHAKTGYQFKEEES